MPPARRPATPTPLHDLGDLDAAETPLTDEGRLEGVVLRGPGTALSARSVTIEACELRGAFGGAVLPDLHLIASVVAGADLANADLRGAALHRSAIHDARLTGLRATGTSLRDLTATACRADLAVLAEARIERVLLRGCDLRDATFDDAQLRDVRFEDCDLAGASFSRARLERVELVGCNLEGLRSVTELRGAAMPWPDLVANAGAFAAAL